MAAIGEGQTAASAAQAATAAASKTGTASADTGTGSRLTHEAPGAAGAGERSAGPAPSAAAVGLTPETMARMRVLRNLRYHEDRQSHYERMSRWSNFATLVLGSGVLATLIAHSSTWTAVIGVATTLVGGSALVFDFGKRAKEEADLKKECARYLSTLAIPNCDYLRVEAELSLMYGSELETYHAVNALAFNAAQLSMDRPKDTLLHVSWWKRFSRHFFTYDPGDFPDVGQASLFMRRGGTGSVSG